MKASPSIFLIFEQKISLLRIQKAIAVIYEHYDKTATINIIFLATEAW